MVIGKRALPRRTILRGLGAVVALPWLDAMVPAFTSASAAVNPVKRLGVIYLPNGVIVKDLIPPTTGAGFEITPILRPLEPFRKHLTVISGLANVAGALSVQGSPNLLALRPAEPVRVRDAEDPLIGNEVLNVVQQPLGDHVPGARQVVQR